MNRSFVRQVDFFSNLKARKSGYYKWVFELAELLQISHDSVYRRMRGESPLSLEELFLICEHFDFSLDNYLGSNSGKIVFDHVPGNSKSIFPEMLDDMITDMLRYEGRKEQEILLATEDLPIFINYASPHLASFKLFFWLRRYAEKMDTPVGKYTHGAVDPSLVEKALQIHTLWHQIPSKEIWNSRILESTLRQITFYAEAGLFAEKHLGTHLCDEISAALLQMEEYAAAGTKDNASKEFQLYHSELMIGNKTILIRSEEQITSYLVTNFFTYMKTRNDDFGQMNFDWINQLTRSAVPMTGISEKWRKDFFNSLQEQVAGCRMAIA